MEKVYEEDNNAEALTRLLKRINAGADPKDLRREAGQLMANVSSKDIAEAEQKLIEAGYAAKLAGQLSAAFVVMGIIEGQKIDLRTQLPDSHIIRKVIAEHDMIRCFLSDLKDVTKVITRKNAMTSASSEFRKLAHIAQHLSAMEEHIESEEDIIFPYLKKHGWTSLCRAAHSDHIYIKIAVSDLMKLVQSYNPEYLDEFKVRLASVTKYLCPTMEEHILQEDNILYPIALEIIKDDKVWQKIKGVCDDIGYCGLHI
ncbi:MAG: DUF438 domain-containing protein [Planctomycetota bacterium]|jgi:DUF438 domain-containing protein